MNNRELLTELVIHASLSGSHDPATQTLMGNVLARMRPEEVNMEHGVPLDIHACTVGKLSSDVANPIRPM